MPRCVLRSASSSEDGGGGGGHEECRVIVRDLSAVEKGVVLLSAAR